MSWLVTSRELAFDSDKLELISDALETPGQKPCSSSISSQHCISPLNGRKVCLLLP